VSSGLKEALGAMSESRVKVGRIVGIAFVLAAMFLYWWYFSPHLVEFSSPKAAAALGQLTDMPASSFGEARFYRVVGVGMPGPGHYSFIATPEVIKRVIVALHMDQPDYRQRMHEDRMGPKWWDDAARESTNDFVYYNTVTSIQMWVSPKDGRCFMLNSRGR
jgi:hypothetical protein